MRFVVDHCVPIEVARWLVADGHQAWTAFQAGLSDADDHDLITYAYVQRAMLVTTNRDCAQIARRQRTARCIWLQVMEVDALLAMQRAVAWLTENRLPAGRVLRVPKRAEPRILTPTPLV